MHEGALRVHESRNKHTVRDCNILYNYLYIYSISNAAALKYCNRTSIVA